MHLQRAHNAHSLQANRSAPTHTYLPNLISMSGTFQKLAWHVSPHAKAHLDRSRVRTPPSADSVSVKASEAVSVAEDRPEERLRILVPTAAALSGLLNTSMVVAGNIELVLAPALPAARLEPPAHHRRYSSVTISHQPWVWLGFFLRALQG